MVLLKALVAFRNNVTLHFNKVRLPNRPAQLHKGSCPLVFSQGILAVCINVTTTRFKRVVVVACLDKKIEILRSRATWHGTRQLRI